MVGPSACGRTGCPPNWWRSAATIRIVGLFCWREEKREQHGRGDRHRHCVVHRLLQRPAPLARVGGVRLEAIETGFGVSRTVAREATRSSRRWGW
ncbi:hypothetical protein [Raineyella sp.]|uniref:hypothetical protein n=1 Tax=Raineyella sp. TaxID=1911550 RepID=UPI002B220C9D|nr:hypothetical protein [Raineyella sp.]MEA5154974.1 hypothetical protein [Raineyella sp.]